MAPLGFVPGLRYSFSVALATLLAAPVVGREDRSRDLMYVLVVPTDAEPTVALEPATISTIPWPFRLNCCVAERQQKRRRGEDGKAKNLVGLGHRILLKQRLNPETACRTGQVQRLMCVTVRGAVEACNRYQRAAR